MAKRDFFQTRIKEDAHAWIENYCKKQDMSKSEFGRRAIYHFIKLKKIAEKNKNNLKE